MKYEIKKSTSFETWIEELKDPVTRNRLLLRLNRVSEGNFGKLDILPALKGLNGDSLLLRSRRVSLLPAGFCC